MGGLATKSSSGLAASNARVPDAHGGDQAAQESRFPRSVADTPSTDRAIATSLIERLLDIIGSETEALQGRRFDALPQLIERKGQALFEFSRNSRLILALRSGPEMSEMLSGLRSNLEVNRRLLRNQIDATLELSRILTQLQLDSECDGTYSACPRRGSGAKW